MQLLKSRRGFSLVEVITVVGIMAFLTIGLTNMMISGLREFDTSTVRTYTDADAINAMQKIVTVIREAKGFQIVDNGTRIWVTMPADSTYGYDRHDDNPNQIEFYCSDSTGTVGHTGMYLWSCTTAGQKQLLKQNVSSISFATDEGVDNSLYITIESQNQSYKGPVHTDLTQRVVYLRNYCK